MSLHVLACPYMPLHVLACPCMSLHVLTCPTCPSMSLHVLTFPYMKPNCCHLFSQKLLRKLSFKEGITNYVPKKVLPISVVVVDANVVAIVAGVVIGGASVVVQVNNFQEIFFLFTIPSKNLNGNSA